MRWLRRAVVGVIGTTFALAAGGCSYDDHDHHHHHHHDHDHYRARRAAYRYEPHHDGWRRGGDWDRRYDRRWDDHDGHWHDRGRWD